MGGQGQSRGQGVSARPALGARERRPHSTLWALRRVLLFAAKEKSGEVRVLAAVLRKQPRGGAEAGRLLAALVRAWAASFWTGL